MTNRRLLILLLAGLLGYGALLLTFPRVNPAARWQQQLDRREAVARARSFAAAQGIDTTGWQELVSMDDAANSEYYLAHDPSPQWARFLTPIITRVTFRDLKQRLAFRASLTTRGDVIEWGGPDSLLRGGVRIGGPPGRPPGGPPGRRPEPTPTPTPADPATAEATRAANKTLAEAALTQLLGDARGQFSPLAQTGNTADATRFAVTGGDDRVKLTADVRIAEGKVAEAGVRRSFTPQFEALLRARRSAAMETLAHAGNAVVWPGLIAALLLYVIALARRQVNHRHTLALLALAFVVLYALNVLNNFTDDFRDDFQINNSRTASTATEWAAWGVVGLLLLLVSFGAYALYVAGLSFSASDVKRRSIDLELLVRGRVWTRPVLGSLAAALSAGGILAALPHVLAATHLIPGLTVAAVELGNIFVARVPALASTINAAHFAIFLTFVFAAPALESLVKRRLLARVLVLLVAFIASCSVNWVYAPASGFLLAALLTAVLLVWLYRRFGTLAAFVALIASQWGCGAAALLAQPHAGLRASGIWALAVLGLIALVALVGYWQARDVRAEELTIARTATTRAERERLQAEFGVARKAQQHMLPDAPPRVPGLRIAAVCQPSKDVGGDLYDFLPLPDGKLGVVVADVSGKGVPASLYMTLTKGLLESVTEAETDPGEILRAVNRHLYEVCRKRMFVTLFLGVLDPQSRTLTFARAGHNPTVHRSPGAQSTRLLKSPGMGLGLNGGKIFDKTLKVEQVQLQPRDKLFFYSDGITEAMNPQQDEYGEERLMQMAETADTLDAEGACRAVLDDVRTFLAGNAPQDDQTLVVIEVTA